MERSEPPTMEVLMNVIRLQRTQIDELINTNNNLQIELITQHHKAETAFHDAYKKVAELEKTDR